MRIQPLINDQNPWWRAPATRHRAVVRQQRDVVAVLVRHLLGDEPPPALVLLGARQIGKTTAVKQAIDEVLDRLDGSPHGRIVYFDFSDDRLPAGVGLRDVLAACPPPEPERRRFLLFDEIQRVGRWDESLKFLIDHASPSALLRSTDRVILTGSQAHDLRRGTRESGPGRWAERFLEPLDFGEFARLAGAPRDAGDRLFALRPDLVDRYLIRGGFPGWMHVEQDWRARQLLREVVTNQTVAQALAEAGVDAVAAGRLLAYLCENSGAKFAAATHAKALRAGTEASYDPRSLVAWRRELEHTGLVVPLPRFTPNAAARIKSKDKVYAVDHGLITAYSPLPEPSRDDEIRARVQKTLVFRHLRALVAARAGGPTHGSISYVDYKNAEVDFAVRIGDALVFVEVTTSTSTKRKMKQVRRIGAAQGATHLAVVHGGLEDTLVDGVRLLPVHLFMQRPDRIMESP